MRFRKLILVRHGETNTNVGGKLHVRDDPRGLNEHGRHQMERVLNRLREFAPEHIYSSRERRSIESAEIVSRGFGLPVHVVDGLAERSWGVLAGRPWSEIKAVLDPLTLDERYNYEPLQGESWKSFEQRLLDTLELILRQNSGTVVLVTHAGAIRALMPHLLGLPKEESFRYDPANASVTAC
jgi:alpha-ribazole phosphatase